MIDPDTVSRLQAKGDGYAIHDDEGCVTVYEIDHRNQTVVASYSEIDWSWSYEEIADWINQRS